MFEILERIGLVGLGPERMVKVAQKMIPVRVVLMVEDTEYLGDGLAIVAAQVAAWISLMSFSEIQGVRYVAAIGR